MSQLLEISLNRLPECWDSCGTCASGDMQVAELLVAPGDNVNAYDLLLVLEVVKADLEITTPRPGRVVSVLVEEGDCVGPDDPLILLQPIDN